MEDRLAKACRRRHLSNIVVDGTMVDVNKTALLRLRDMYNVLAARPTCRVRHGVFRRLREYSRHREVRKCSFCFLS